MQQLLTAAEAAKRLSLATKSLRDKRFRARIGLRVVKIGKRIAFEEGDIARLIARGLERLPTVAGGHDASRR